MNIIQLLEDINGAKECSILWDGVAEYLRSQSVAGYVYHHLPAPGALDYTEKFHVKRAIQENSEILCDIVHHQFKTNFQNRARSMVNVRFWGDPCVTDRVDSEAVMSELENKFSLSGVTLPVHGPGGRNGCFSIIFSQFNQNDIEFDLQSVRWVCQSAHQSYCRILIDDDSDIPKLTPRETEILSWMALGKTNNEIATCLDISSHTVSTYARRIFLKTNTADRTSASLYGISNGLLRF